MFREELPADCPPNEAIEITYEMLMYRLVKALPPVEEDFVSHKKQKPHIPYSKPCLASGLSLEKEYENASKRLLIPKFKEYSICKVRLDNGAGKIKPDSPEQSHHCWWPYADFEILNACEETE